MKKVFLTSALTGFLLLTVGGLSLAAVKPTPTETPSPTSAQAITQIDQQINNLKDTIASKVAELHLVSKEGIIGTVTDVSQTQITVTDAEGNIHFIDVDELTKFSSPNSTSSTFGISAITKNSTIGVLGLYNKDSRRLLARFVNVLTLPTYIHGAIAAIDRTNDTITVAQNDGTQTVVEVADITKTLSYDQTAGLVRSGFSKAQAGERVNVIGYIDKQNSKQVIASRVLIFPTLPINPKIGTAVQQLPTATLSAIPSK